MSIHFEQVYIMLSNIKCIFFINLFNDFTENIVSWNKRPFVHCFTLSMFIKRPAHLRVESCMLCRFYFRRIYAKLDQSGLENLGRTVDVEMRKSM